MSEGEQTNPQITVSLASESHDKYFYGDNFPPVMKFTTLGKDKLTRNWRKNVLLIPDFFLISFWSWLIICIATYRKHMFYEAILYLSINAIDLSTLKK